MKVLWLDPFLKGAGNIAYNQLIVWLHQVICYSFAMVAFPSIDIVEKSFSDLQICMA